MIADRIISLLVGRPVRSVLIGAVLLYATGHYLDWWVPVLIAGGSAIDFVVFVRRRPMWRLW